MGLKLGEGVRALDGDAACVGRCAVFYGKVQPFTSKNLSSP